MGPVSGLFATGEELLVCVSISEWQKAGGCLLVPEQTLEGGRDASGHRIRTELAPSGTPDPHQ